MLNLHNYIVDNAFALVLILMGLFVMCSIIELIKNEVKYK